MLSRETECSGRKPRSDRPVTAAASYLERKRQSFLVLSPLVPSRAQQESAGEVLLKETLKALDDLGDVHVLTRDCPSNRRALQRGDTPEHTMLPARQRFLDGRFYRLVGMTPALSASDLLRHWTRLRWADTIDIQWEETAMLLPLLRLLRPHAHIVVTLHDVVSQAMGRRRSSTWSRRRRALLRLQISQARLLERAICLLADDVIVLSEKDAALLPIRGRRARVSIVAPPIQGRLRAFDRPAGPPTLLFVGYMARPENTEAAVWMAEEILPRVRRAAPDVRAVIAGGGMSPDLAARLENGGVHVLGFVEDLEPLYDSADVCLIPLSRGAGVKFKTIDALVRGVPVVTTPVGNEGINPADAAYVADTAEGLAAQVIRILNNQEAANARACASAARVAAVYGPEQFEARLKEVYA